MSNQALLWTMVIVPWLSLFLMKKEDIKRYMPAGLFSSFLLVILQEIGVANSWWYFQETIYPLAIFTPFTESVDLIIPMWVLKYTYRRFWYYILVEIVGNVVFFFIILPWFANRDYGLANSCRVNSIYFCNGNKFSCIPFPYVAGRHLRSFRQNCSFGGLTASSF